MGAAWILSVFLFWPSFGFRFVNFDDYAVLVNHPELFDLPTWKESLRAILWEAYPREEPLLFRDLTWLVDSRVFGFPNPFGYHLGNVLLHATNVVAVYLIGRSYTQTRAAAVLGLIWFGVGAVHVEPVCWVMGRKDLLSALFMFSAILVERNVNPAPSVSEQFGRKAASFVLLMLALFSKAGAYGWVLVLIAQDMLQRQAWRPKSWAMVLVRFSPHLAGTLLYVVWYKYELDRYGNLGRGPGPLTLTHVRTLLEMIPVVFTQNLRLLIYPFDYSIYYDYPMLYRPISSWDWMLGVLTLLGSGWFILRWRKHHPSRSLLLFASFCSLLPYLNVVYVGIWTANRYLYIASALLFLPLFDVIASRWPVMHRSARAGLVAAFGCLILVHGVASRTIMYAWQDDESLWRYENLRPEPTLLARKSLAYSLFSQSSKSKNTEDKAVLIQEATSIIDKALSADLVLSPPDAAYYTGDRATVSHLYALRGMIAEAREEPLSTQLAHYLKAYEIKPVDEKNTAHLAETTLRMAQAAQDPERNYWANRSLDYLALHLSYSIRDPIMRAEGFRRLDEAYAREFPALQPRIEQLKAALQRQIQALGV
jgi:hypothetical protein